MAVRPVDWRETDCCRHLFGCTRSEHCPCRSLSNRVKPEHLLGLGYHTVSHNREFVVFGKDGCEVFGARNKEKFAAQCLAAEIINRVLDGPVSNLPVWWMPVQLLMEHRITSAASRVWIIAHLRDRLLSGEGVDQSNIAVRTAAHDWVLTELNRYSVPAHVHSFEDAYQFVKDSLL